MGQVATGARTSTSEGLPAFISDVYDITNSINKAELGAYGPRPQDIVSLVEPGSENEPSRDMLVAGVAHTLMHHVLPAQEGPLAVMGERARHHTSLLESLGEAGLGKELRRHIDWLMIKAHGRLGYGQAGPDAARQVTALVDGARVNGSVPVLRKMFAWPLSRQHHATRSALRDILFSPEPNQQ